MKPTDFNFCQVIKNPAFPELYMRVNTGSYSSELRCVATGIIVTNIDLILDEQWEEAGDNDR